MTEDTDPVSRSEFEQLQNRVEELEKKLNTPTRSDTGLDRYEARVVEQLDEGEVVGITRFKSLLNAAGVHQPGKVKRRMKTLTNRDCFEETGAQAWRFVGVADE